MNITDIVFNDTVELSNYGLKGLSYTKKDILNECIKTIDQAIINKAFWVLFIILFTTLSGSFFLNLLEKNKHHVTQQFYLITKDFLNNLWIIDYSVMIFYLVWIILISKAW